MKLITEELNRLLQANDHSTVQHPVCKFFNPCGAATWLIFAREKGEDDDILWGLGDLGFGCVEWGTISLSELESVRLPMGLKIERDLHWKPKTHTNGELWNLSNYLELDTLSGI
jgi:hypothetical protein